jgi:hypothetical protein
MTNLWIALRFSVVSICLVLLLTRSVEAYIDPGTGSYVFQLLIAGLLGAAFTAKVFWKRIAAFLTGVTKRSNSSKGDDSERDSRKLI